MRAFLLMFAVIVLHGSAAWADQRPFRAGIVRITVQDVESFDATVWYPTGAAEASFQVGPFTIDAARDAAIAEGRRFPVILLSHGRRGSPFGHRGLAANLAREGFIVVAPTHVGDASGQAQPRPQRRILADRPRQARLALDRLLADPRFSQRADAAQIGAIGFSAGGYTALVLAGARPDLGLAAAYCREHAGDIGPCGPAVAPAGEAPAQPGDGRLDLPSMRDLRLKALVLMDPLAIMFDSAGLAAVTMPTLLLRPQNDDYVSGKGNALSLAAALPRPPQQIVVPGSHFVFLEPCPPAVAEAAALLCKDAPGVDRAAVHRRIESEVASFLRQNL